jgi:thiamine kinase-like enzyme
VLALVTLHKQPCEGLLCATPAPAIEVQLAAERRIGDHGRAVRKDSFVHWDVNPSNILIDGTSVRFVDWEYSGRGDPSGDVASLCTSPSSADMPDELVGRLIAEHAAALGDELLVERTNAWIIAMLTYWCCRSAASAQLGEPERDIDPRRSAVARIDQYRERLAAALKIKRTEIDRALSR